MDRRWKMVGRGMVVCGVCGEMQMLPDLLDWVEEELRDGVVNLVRCGLCGGLSVVTEPVRRKLNEWLREAEEEYAEGEGLLLECG